MAEHHVNTGDDGENTPLPSAEEIERRFGKPARAQWEKSREFQRRGLLSHFEAFPHNPVPQVRLSAEARKSLVDALSLHQLHVLAPGAEQRLRDMRARLDGESSDAENAAINALCVRVIDFLLAEKLVDFTDVRRAVLEDPRCASFDEKRVSYEYQRFTDTLSFNRLITPDRGIGPDDEL